MESQVDDIRNDIMAQPAMFNDLFQDWNEQADKIAHSLNASWGKIKRVYLIGCGDSYFAGVAAHMMWSRMTGIDVHSVTSMEFSRYRIQTIDSSCLIVGVSLSGKTIRTIEGLTMAKHRGAVTIALSNRNETPLGEQGEHKFHMGLQNIPQYLYGLRAYTAQLTGLYLLALQIGRMRGLPIQNLVDLLRAYPSLAEQVIQEVTNCLPDLLSTIKPGKTLIFLGAGPNLASASYAQGKLYEASSYHSLWQEIEEWAHEQCHAGSPDMVTVLFTPRGAATNRAVEIVKAIKALGGSAFVFSDAPELFPKDADSRVLMPAWVEEFTPLLYALPSQIFSLHLAQALNTLPRRLASDETYRMINWSLIQNSEMVS
jgi:glucosamine 6-phosphate synthetase-like amidotransferase/phosphosugar isomerase protein